MRATGKHRRRTSAATWGRDIPRPAIGDAERDDADRVKKLPVEQVCDDVLDIGSLDVAFAVDQADLAEIIDNEAGVLIPVRAGTIAGVQFELRGGIGKPATCLEERVLTVSVIQKMERDHAQGNRPAR